MADRREASASPWATEAEEEAVRRAQQAQLQWQQQQQQQHIIQAQQQMALQQQQQPFYGGGGGTWPGGGPVMPGMMGFPRPPYAGGYSAPTPLSAAAEAAAALVQQRVREAPLSDHYACIDRSIDWPTSLADRLTEINEINEVHRI